MNCHKRIFTLIILITIISCVGVTSVSLAAENRGRGTPADALPKELKNVSVKDYFLPGKTREAGAIQTAIGHVVVARGDLSQAYFAANGDKLYEQDIVFTLKASKCRIKLVNNDVITLGDHTRITVKEVSGGRNTPEKKSDLSMARGKAMFYAIRLLSQKGTTMSVASPTAVAGVRGTKFGMEVSIEGEKTTGALPLLLADASDDWGRHLILAQANQPPVVTTTVHGFDGTVSVTSTVDGSTQNVGAGQTLSTSPLGMGTLMPTPPQVSQRFQSETNVPPPGGGGGGDSQSSGISSSTGSGNAPSVTTTSDSAGTSTTNTVDTSSITQQQNVNREEQQAPIDPVTDPKTNASGNKVGYFASLLSNLTGGTLAEVFASQNRYDSNSNVWARGTKDAGTDYTRVLGGGGGGGGFGTPTLKWVVFDSGTKNSGELSSPISSTTIAENSYMEWGYATVPSSFTVGSASYAFDNRTYWIFGYNTPSMERASVVANYSGPAYGTYWTSSGGSNMTGSFSSRVNFTSAMLSGFQLNVSGNGVYASIDSASGSIASDASFSITGGTWNLNGVTPDQTSAKGSLYGPNSVYMGGAWGMYSSIYNTGAVGIFQGDKTVVATQQMGHFAGMLENGAMGYYEDTYMNTVLQGFQQSSVLAMNTANTYFTRIDGTGATKNMVELGTSMGTWTGSQPVTFSQVGSNEYMEWGTWTQATAMNITGVDMYFKNQGAYVWGTPTSDSDMATLKSNMITANYSGPAWGTFFVGNSPGTSMNGTFSGTVNFASPAVTGFNINVSGGGNSVAIQNATGSFSGATSTFTIDPNSASAWTINGSPADNKGATGTVYGTGADKGKYIGGVWKAGFSTIYNAVGGFQGSK